jgi:pimeloyl-ACP methyl ester carboxylesterase
MDSMKEDQLKVPGASLYYEMRGSGPVLLMIPGGPTDANIFAGLAPRLSDSYTVVTYDPRGLSRSKLYVVPEDHRIVEIMADDAHRLLTAVGSEPAFVFGNSGGALIALELVTHHSQQVQTLVAHEPPAAALLPDGPAVLTAMQEVYDTYRSLGIGPAMQKFLAVAGLAGDQPPSESGLQGEPDPKMLEAMRGMQRNLEFFLAHYLRPVTGYRPNIAALLTGLTRVVAAVGEESAGQLAYRGGVELAEQLGTEVMVFPGDHSGFVTHSDEFAAKLHKMLMAG